MVLPLRWAGGVAAAALLAVTTVAAEPVAAQASLEPTLAGRCWIGSNRPVFQIVNTDPARSLQYSAQSGSSSRGGSLERSGRRSTAYFVASGRYPNAAPVELEWSKKELTGTAATDVTDPVFCTYNLRPQLRWRGPDGRDVAAPATTKGMVITIAGALERITCTGAAKGGLDCIQQALPTSPLAPGTYRGARRELQVPVFRVDGGAPSYSVTVTPPAGYRVAGGSGSFVLPDLGAGLGQGNADGRLRSFLGGRGHLRSVPVTFQVDAPTSTTTTAPATTVAPTTTVASPSPPATVRAGNPQQRPGVAPPTPVAAAVAPTSPPRSVTSVERHPWTAPVNPAVVAGGVAALVTGLGIVLLTRVRRRRTRRPWSY
jgi:hypothetical protein